MRNLFKHYDVFPMFSKVKCMKAVIQQDDCSESTELRFVM